MPKKPKWNEQACPACKEPSAADATICPHCRTAFTSEQVDARKKAHAGQTKFGMFGCFGIIAIIFLISTCSGSEEKGGTAAKQEAMASSQGQDLSPADDPPLEEPELKLTPPQQNALRSAEQYNGMTGFSRQGLIDQLSSDAGEGYEVADATIAVDNLVVDWNEQAARSAKQYLDMSGFSCKGLIQQLSSSAGDKYTKSQATYGAQQAGAC